MPAKTTIKIDKARISDVPAMHKLINQFAGNGEMLARPLSELYENIRDFHVARKGRKVVGCAALHLMWSDLAEVKSVAVAGDEQRLGVGNKLIEACLDDARELHIETVFCFTYKPGFFKQVGFKVVDKMTLPHKVWTECLRCPKFPNCDETAMTLVLKQQKK
jgi:amino-acid N-acetyltransferase